MWKPKYPVDKGKIILLKIPVFIAMRGKGSFKRIGKLVDKTHRLSARVRKSEKIMKRLGVCISARVKK